MTTGATTASVSASAYFSLSRVIVDEIHQQAEAKLRGVPTLTAFYTCLAVLGTFPKELLLHVAARHLDQHRIAREARFQRRCQQQQQQHQQHTATAASTHNATAAAAAAAFKAPAQALQQSLLDVIVVCGFGHGGQQHHGANLLAEEAAAFDNAMMEGTTIVYAGGDAERQQSSRRRNVTFRFKAVPVQGNPDQRVAAYSMASKMVLEAAKAERDSKTVRVEDGGADHSRGGYRGGEVIVERAVLFVSAWFLVADILHQRISPLLLGGVVFLNAQRVGPSERFALSLLQPRDAFEQASVESQLGIRSMFSIANNSSRLGDDSDAAAIPRWGLCLSGQMAWIARPLLTTLNPVLITLYPRVRAVISNWIDRHSPSFAHKKQQLQQSSSNLPPSLKSDVYADIVPADPLTSQLVAVLRRILNELVVDLNATVLAAAEKYESVQTMLDYFVTSSAQATAAAAGTGGVAGGGAPRNHHHHHHHSHAAPLIHADALLPQHAFLLLRRVASTLPITSRCRDVCESLLHVRRLLRIANRVDPGTFMFVLQHLANEAVWCRQEEAAHHQQPYNNNNNNNNTNNNNNNNHSGNNSSGSHTHQHHGGVQFAPRRNLMISGPGDNAPLLWLMSPSFNELTVLAERRVFEQRDAAWTAEEQRQWHEQQRREAANQAERLRAAVQRIAALPCSLYSGVFATAIMSNPAHRASGGNDADADAALAASLAEEETARLQLEMFVQRCIAQVRPQQRPGCSFTLRVPVVYRRLRELVARMLTKRSAAAASLSSTVRRANTSNNDNNINNRSRGRGVIVIIVPHRNDSGSDCLRDVELALTLNKLSDVQNAMVSRFARNVAYPGSGGGAQQTTWASMVSVMENLANAGHAAQLNANNFGALNKFAAAAEVADNQHQLQLMRGGPGHVLGTAAAAVAASASAGGVDAHGQRVLLDRDDDGYSAIRRVASRAQSVAGGDGFTAGRARGYNVAPIEDLVDEDEAAMFGGGDEDGGDDEDSDATATTAPSSQKGRRGSKQQQQQQQQQYVSVGRAASSGASRAVSIAGGANGGTSALGAGHEDPPHMTAPQMTLFSSHLVQLCNDTTSHGDDVIRASLSNAVLTQLQQHSHQTQQQMMQRLSEQHQIEISPLKTQLKTKATQDVVDVDALSDDDDGVEEVNIIPAPINTAAATGLDGETRRSNIKRSFSPAAVTPPSKQCRKEGEREEEVQFFEEPIASLFASDAEELELHSRSRLMRDGPSAVRYPNPQGIAPRDMWFYHMHAALDICAVTLNSVTPSLLRELLNPNQYQQRQLVCLDANQLLMRTLELLNAEEAIALTKATAAAAAAAVAPPHISTLRIRIIAEEGSHSFGETSFELQEESRNVNRLSHERINFTPSFQYRSTQPLFTTTTPTSTPPAPHGTLTKNNTSNNNAGSGAVSFAITSATTAKIPTVLVDDRELRAELPFWLHHERGLRLVPLTLTRGDYIVSADLAIERKATKDLFQSIKSGRLNNQLAQMQSFFRYTMVLVELSNSGSAPAKTVDFGSLALHFTKENFAKMLLNRVGTGLAASLDGAAAATAGGSRAATVTIATTGGGSPGAAIGPLAPSARQQLSVIWSTGPRHSAAMIQRLKLTMAVNDPDPADPALAVQQAAATTDELRSHSAREVLARIPGCGFVTVSKVSSKIANCLASFARCSREKLETVLSAASAEETFKFLSTPLTNESLSGSGIMGVFDSAPANGGGGRKVTFAGL